MPFRVVKFSLFLLVIAFVTVSLHAQPDASDSLPTRRRPPDPSTSLKSMIAKQQADRDKRDHREMLERGEQALRLANQLGAAFDQNKKLSSEDKVRLESLQQVVEKIRKELGGDDDDDVEDIRNHAVAEDKPSTIEDAFKFLHSTTVRLVDELKKTTRFSISAIAIQSSNSVIKIVKFLRFRK